MSSGGFRVRSKAIAASLLSLVLSAGCAEEGADLSQRGSDVKNRRSKGRTASKPTPKHDRKKQAHDRDRPKKERPKKKERSLSIEARGVTVYVSRVIDGDTIEVMLRGTETDVRLIGFDTPETVHPSQPVECFGKAASAYSTRSLEGHEVSLEFDVEREDQYGRTLAYVWIGKTLFNEQILRDGFAQVSTYPPNVKYVDRFLSAQRHARSAERGLWSQCRGEGANSAGSTETSPTHFSSNGNCDGNYVGACVPSYPPDVDCSDVPAVDFTSKGSDPHGFDGDSDGVACES